MEILCARWTIGAVLCCSPCSLFLLSVRCIAGPNAPATPNQAGRYTPRIYLTEGSGAVLGANAINEHNVIFDPDNMRVGFARSTCSYDKSHARHDFATSTNGAHPPLPPPVNEQSSSTPTKANKAPSKAARTDPLTAASAPSASAPKTTTKVRKPSTSAGSGLKAASSASKATTQAASKLNLTPAHKKAVMTVIGRAVDAFMQARHAPCRPVLAMPCNARCDRMPFSDPMIPDMGKNKHVFVCSR